MLQLPLVSIMIATYNQARYIEQAVESALLQDYKNIEVIVSDDSTNEETKKLLEKYYEDARFHYHKNEENIGRVANYRNLLFNLARGEWVVMLDGDDYYNDNHYITRAIEYITTNHNIVLAGAGINILHESNGIVSERKLVEGNKIFCGKEVFYNKLQLPHHSTDLYRRDLAIELDFYRHPSMGSDSESLFRLCLHGNIIYLKECVVTWRVHNDNTTFTREINTQIKELDFIDHIYLYAQTFIDKNSLKKWYSHMYEMMINHIFSLAEKSKNYKALLRLSTQYSKYISKKRIIKGLLRISK